jgi:hypothetical protein
MFIKLDMLKEWGLGITASFKEKRGKVRKTIQF